MESVIALDKAVHGVFRYRDENIEMIRTPSFMAQEWEIRGYLEGDCDDISTFQAAVTTALNISSRFVAIRTSANPEYSHVFLEALLPNQVYRLDATVNPRTRMEYYGEPLIERVI